MKLCGTPTKRSQGFSDSSLSFHLLPGPLMCLGRANHTTSGRTKTFKESSPTRLGHVLRPLLVPGFRLPRISRTVRWPASKGPSQGISRTPVTAPLEASSTITFYWACKAILHGGKKDLDVEKYATAPQEEYQIVVQSEDMAHFVRHDEKSFQANAFLGPKKSKQKIVPAMFSTNDRPGRKECRVQLQARRPDPARQLRASEDGG